MTQITNIMDTAGQWLLKHQDLDSGGWADRSGGHANALNTAEAIIALIDGGVCAAGATSIQKAIQFLYKHQIDEGQDQGYWPREVVMDHGNTVYIPDLVRTTFTVQALFKAGRGLDQLPVQKALKWLLSVRDEGTKGWRYAGNKSSELIPTCFALTAFLIAYKECPGNCKEQILESLERLVDTYYNSGGDETRGSFGDPGPLQGVHTIYAALVLQFARNCNLTGYQKQENEAIEWLLRHPDMAIKLREEWVAIDKSNAAGHQVGGYGFMFMTDTLLIRLLMGSDNVDDRKTKLARDAMNSLKDRLDENTGAFYGYRLFSWSTAKSLSALSVLQKHAGAEFTDFPERPSEYKGWKIGPVILGFAVLLSVFGFYLKISEKFDLLTFSFFSIMMLAALLAYGLVGEKTFKELFSSIISNLKVNKVTKP